MLGKEQATCAAFFTETKKRIELSPKLTYSIQNKSKTGAEGR
jgi:hypothetical protein